MYMCLALKVEEGGRGGRGMGKRPSTPTGATKPGL